MQGLVEIERRIARHRAAGGGTRPFVTLAYAQSLDGSIAIERGARLHLSGGPALAMTHALRALHAGILIGIETAATDDPELTVRFSEGAHPQPIIVDSALRLSPKSRVFSTDGHRPWVATTQGASTARETMLTDHGATVVRVPALANGWVDLGALLRELHARGLSSIMVEGGQRILSSFVQSGLADHAVVTLAPVLVAGLPALVRLPGPFVMPRVAPLGVERVGEDVVLSGPLHFPVDGPA